MKKRIGIAVAAVVGLVLVLWLGLQGYIAVEEKKRADAPGNAAAYDVGNLERHPDSPLQGKTIPFLGSSVTFGASAEGQSFVELFAALDGVVPIKEAKSGTTLVDKPSLAALIAFGDGDSYVKRLKALDPNQTVDCVVCQLSTNDATLKYPLGEISSSEELSSFDTQTITGAMEYVIRYCQDTWRCPVVFYTGSYYDSPEYAAMVQRLMELQEKWDIGVIDLYYDTAFNDIDAETYDFYMYDSIHPTKAGYIQWWMPKIEQELIEILAEKG